MEAEARLTKVMLDLKGVRIPCWITFEDRRYILEILPPEERFVDSEHNVVINCLKQESVNG